MRLNLPTEAKLRTKSEFELVKGKALRQSGPLMGLNVLRSPELVGPRLGIITTRKLGNACQRSRARRLIRESFRLHRRELLENCYLVAVARRAICGQKRASVEKEFMELCRKAGIVREES